MKKKYSLKTIHLEGNGFEKALGELESKIMMLIWDEGKATTRFVRDALARQKRDLSFNAVMTVMNRLVDKGILKKKIDGRVYSYTPVMSKEKFSRMITKDIISAVVKDPSLFSVASFTELLDELDKGTIDKLKKFLNK